MADLEYYRKELDKVDAEIVKLFEERMDLIDGVTEYKIEHGREVLDPAREERKLSSVADQTSSAFNREGIQELFRQLMAISRKKEYDVMTRAGAALPFDQYEQVDSLDFHKARVVFQGVEGAYSFEAMKTFFDDSITSSKVKTWKDAMQMVAGGSADYAVLPIENTTAGSVSDMYDLLPQFENYIVGEQIIRIDHMLMGLQEAKLSDIRKVYSHPQGLAQCKNFLDGHPDWERVPVLNTAMGAEKVARDGDISQAAIASRTAAEYFGLKILQEGGMSAEKNATRFFIVGRKKIFRRDAGKISICFGLPHETGTLYGMLSHIAFNGLNMTKIESRPVPERPFTYRFFIDFEGNLSDPAVQNALRGIQEEAGDLRILGNY
ncbi:MAG: bifunctional chorismate mutase/prephenate dehydratase [Eubacterium sp.]|nr:bifunctional chorismate mutase/prephenate dehydratase [Eubacterium sp.]